jgi:hypothetical protein
VCGHILRVRMTAWCRCVQCSTAGRIFGDLLPEDYEEKFTLLRAAEGIGRPLGTTDFVTELEHRLGRPIAHRAPGRRAVAIPVGEQLNLLQ